MGDSRVLSRLRGASSTIAYLGTSVSVQRSGYRPRLHAMLEDSTGYGHQSVLAGVGGADALAGVFLVDRLVLPHAPDVCFVEFATIDAVSPTAVADLDRALDSIVRKLLRAACEPCLLQMPLGDEGAGAAASRRRGREVSERYGVPYVALDEHLLACVRDGSLLTEEVLKDGLHLAPRGAQAAAEHILDVLHRGTTPSPGEGEGEPNWSGDGLGHYDRTEIIPVRREWFADPEQTEWRRLNLVQEFVRVLSGNPLTHRFDGELFGLLAVLGPESGWLAVSSLAAEEELLLWDADCRYQRLGVVLFGHRPPPGAPVRIELLDRPAQVERPAHERPTTDLRLIGVLVRKSGDT